jgi:tRNA dimethylallyltransferase
MNNNQQSTKTLIVVAGPTAIGKTAAAIQLARHFDTAILSADSRQFYREMSIGTAKPTEEELAQAKHYFINSHSITDVFTVADFEKQALTLLDELFLTNNVVILAGGSGLYIKAVCEGFDEIPSVAPGIRDNWNKKFSESGIQPLQEKLKLDDPVYYATVDLNNPQRIIRALEVFEGTGKPISSYRTAKAIERPFKIIKIGLNLPKEVLYQRINSRVDVMVEHGLVQEAENLLPHKQLNALNTVGYSEIFDYLDGKTNFNAAIELIKQNTRHFAKRQLTWFRKDKDIHWFEADTSLPHQLNQFLFNQL